MLSAVLFPSCVFSVAWDVELLVFVSFLDVDVDVDEAEAAEEEVEGGGRLRFFLLSFCFLGTGFSAGVSISPLTRGL